MPEPDLLITKFTVPPVRSTLLARSHLLDILDQSRSVPLTLLSASDCHEQHPESDPDAHQRSYR